MLVNAVDDVKYMEDVRFALLMLRLTVMALLVALLTLHLRSVRVFRWEQSVSGGVLVTYLIVAAGLAICAGSADRKITGIVVQCYLCGTGAILLILNAITLWARWRRSGDLTQAVADLLSALGVPVRKQVSRQRLHLIFSNYLAIVVTLNVINLEMPNTYILLKTLAAARKFCVEPGQFLAFMVFQTDRERRGSNPLTKFRYPPLSLALALSPFNGSLGITSLMPANPAIKDFEI